MASSAGSDARPGSDGQAHQPQSSRIGAYLSAAYLEVDGRSLGLFRILFGLILLGDLVRHVPGMSTWFLDGAVVSPEWIERLEAGKVPLSVFLLSSNTLFVVLMFGLIGAVFASYTLGYRTRLCQVLALAAVVSLHGRNDFIEHAGERSIHILALLTAFMPLGRRFSIDAVRAGGKADVAPFRSIAFMAFLFQFAAAYLFDRITKGTGSWTNGTALLAAISPQTGSTLGILLRDAAPLDFFRFLGVLTLLFEYLLAVALVIPVPFLRPFTGLLMVLLHLGIMTFMNLGVFQPTMAAPAALLLTADCWTWLGRSRDVAPLRRLLAKAKALLERRFAGGSVAIHAQRHGLVVAREIGAGLLAACLGILILRDNDPVPSAIRPDWATPLANAFLRIGVFETWNHFKDPQFVDSMLYVDALTSDGRHVDPLNEEISGHRCPPITEMPRQQHISLQWWNFQKYARSPNDRLLVPLSEWLERYPLRTKNPDDALVSYEIRRLNSRRDWKGNRIESRSFLLFSKGVKPAEPPPQDVRAPVE